MRSDAFRLVGACAWPSEAYWRVLELESVRRIAHLRTPVLELGCGDGMFTELAGLHVDHAIDREPRAVERAARRSSVYDKVSRLDAHQLSPELGRFGTVFSNSVLEHVPDVEAVLERCREILVPGGQLIATVPLSDMNHHLLVGAPRYARARQRQLEHRNLWSLPEWDKALRAAGFGALEADTYLDAAACRRWDALDVVGALGRGRYRVAPAVHKAASLLLTTGLKERLKERLAGRIAGWARRDPEGADCAALLVATVPE